MIIEDFDGLPESGLYYGGRAGRKAGVLIDGEPWILKFPRPGRELAGRHVPSYTSSPVSEWVASHIYESLGIPAHETRLGYREGHVVCACRDFTWPDARLFEFSQLKTAMSDDQPGFFGSPSDGSVTFLADVLATISQVPVLRDTPGVTERFWDMFVVDALVKNPDRNNGNWGLLVRPGRPAELAPVYDCGSSLFAKRTESVAGRRLGGARELAEDAFATNVSCYMAEDPDTGEPRHIHPFEYMAQTRDPDLLAAVARVTARADVAAMEAIVDEVPAEWRGRNLMGPAMREQHKLLLRERLERGILPAAERARALLG